MSNLDPDIIALEQLNKRLQKEIDLQEFSKITSKDLIGNNPTNNNELIQAAIAYMLNDFRFWPWYSEYWKPSTPIENLIKSRVLIAAEIERRLLLEKENEA